MDARHKRCSRICRKHEKGIALLKYSLKPSSSQVSRRDDCFGPFMQLSRLTRLTRLKQGPTAAQSRPIAQLEEPESGLTHWPRATHFQTRIPTWPTHWFSLTSPPPLPPPKLYCLIVNDKARAGNSVAYRFCPLSP